MKAEFPRTKVAIEFSRTSSAPTLTPTSTPAGALAASGTCSPLTVDRSGICTTDTSSM